MKNMKKYAILALLALTVVQTTTAAEAWHHHYYDRYDRCDYHRHFHRYW